MFSETFCFFFLTTGVIIYFTLCSAIISVVLSDLFNFYEKSFTFPLVLALTFFTLSIQNVKDYREFASICLVVGMLSMMFVLTWVHDTYI
jgi:hypothetical protein